MDPRAMSAWLPYVLVGAGGCLGAISRYAVGRGIGAIATTAFPAGTFVINIAGSFLLGVLGVWVARHTPSASESLRLALGVGFLGAFTTFSSFEFETNALIAGGAWVTAALYVGASVALGLAAVRLGIQLATAWLG